eukprot:1289865-Rhodomonas_salina.4
MGKPHEWEHLGHPDCGAMTPNILKPRWNGMVPMLTDSNTQTTNRMQCATAVLPQPECKPPGNGVAYTTDS